MEAAEGTANAKGPARVPVERAVMGVPHSVTPQSEVLPPLSYLQFADKFSTGRLHSRNHIYTRIESSHRQSIDTDHFYLKVGTPIHIRS